MVEELNIIKNDPWLEPFSAAIEGRHSHAIAKRKRIVQKKKSGGFCFRTLVLWTAFRG